MKSTDVYRVLRERLGALCKAEGFRRIPGGGMLGWHRPLEREHLVVWFQCSRHGWDPYHGSQFTLELQRSPTPVIGVGFNSVRFPQLLTLDELEIVRRMQNRIIDGLRRPPVGHWSEQLQGRSLDWYQAQFEPVAEPYEQRQDVWLRYASAADVEGWANFLAERFTRMVADFEMRSAGG